MGSVFNQLSDYILIINNKDIITFANDKLLNKLGYNSLELLNKDIKNLTNHKFVNFKNASGEEKLVNVEIEFLTKSQTIIKLDSKLIIDEFKNEKCLFVIAKDIEEYSYTKQDLETLLNNIEIATFIKDANGKYIYASDHIQNILGKSPEKIIGRYDEEIWSKHMSDAFKKSDIDVINNKVAKLYEEPSKIADSSIWYETYKSPIYDENNNLKYIIGTSRDITLQKIIRDGIYRNYSQVISQKSRDNQDIYSSLKNISDNIINCLGAQGLSILLYDKEKRELHPYIKLKNAKNIYKNVDKIILTKEEEEDIIGDKVEYGFRTINKVKKQASIEKINLEVGNIEYLSTYPMKLSDELVGILAISYSKGNEPKYNQDDYFYEMADRLAMIIQNYKLSNELKLENQKRRESEKELQLYLSISVDLKATATIDGYIHKANSAWERLLGWSPSELICMHYSELINKDDIKLIEQLYENNVITETIKYITLRFLCKNGEQRWIEISLKYVKEQNVFLFTGKDFTKRKAIEEEKQKLEEAIQLETIRNEFFANISHEFKTPLNIILGTIQLIDKNLELDNITKESTMRYAKTLKQNAYRLLRLVNNLIDISRIDIGYYNLQLSNYNIIKIIEDITLSVAEYVQGKNINLLFDTEIEELVLACDPDKIERVMLNLLSNAIKYTDNGGNINVYLKTVDENLIVSVKDSGVGIPKDKLGLIFDRFGQANYILTRRCEGSGIGLSIVKSIVEMHGGEINVYSEIGKGTEFIFNIPIKTLKEENIIINSENKYGHIEKCSIEFSDIYNI